MKVLFWVPPWEAQGDLFFFDNAFQNHLLPQANTLADAGFEVTLAIGEGYLTPHLNIARGIKIVPLNQLEASRLLIGHPDPNVELHSVGKECAISLRIAEWLEGLLPANIDIVLLWENPAPFFEALYPSAVVISQMPGTFARDPFPHLVTFDPAGLYRRSSLVTIDEIRAKPKELSATSEFKDKTRDIFTRLRPYSRDALTGGKGVEGTLSLLPLQISAHYAFRAETQYSSQRDLLLDAISSVRGKDTVIVTQYNSRHYSDRVMNEALVRLLQKHHPNVIYRSEFDEIPTISQLLLPICDRILTASSSIGLQALVWNKQVRVFGETGLGVIHQRIETGEYSSDDVLATMLFRQQPLAQLVVHDGEFMSRLLEDIHGKRSLPACQRLPCMMEIDDRYTEKLLSSFRERDAERILLKRKLLVARSSLSERMAKHLRNKELRAISFDLFDTLLVRPLERPADAYALLQSRAAHCGLLPSGLDLANLRLEAELETRRSSDAEEVTLDQIYEELASSAGLNPETTAKIKSLELRLEVELARPREIGKRLWDVAVGRGLPILITSDMYLPQPCIEEMLAKAGYEGYSKLYLSSVAGVTKRTGKLFKRILSDLSIESRQLLHLGDNERTDIRPAKALGITTVHIPSAASRIVGSKSLGLIFERRKPIEPVVRSVIVSAIARKIFDDADSAAHEGVFGGNPYQLGYCGLGPAILGYANWIRMTAVRKGIGSLYFLSREGLIIKQVFDQICEANGDELVSHYLWGSRRALRVASLKSDADIRELCRHPVALGSTISDVMRARFGIGPPTLTQEVLRTAGFSSLEQRLDALPDKLLRLSALATNLSPAILSNAEREREGYLRYLSSLGIAEGRSPALVDIGWGANIQGSLGRLIKAPVVGLYYSTLADAAKWLDVGHEIYSYSSHLSLASDGCALLSNRLFSEYLICEESASIERIESDELGQFVPIRSRFPENRIRREFVSQVHCGVRDFAREVLSVDAKALARSHVDPRFATKMLSEFFSRPAKVDAEMMLGHYLVDEFGGLPKGYFVSPPRELKDAEIYWRKGHDALKAESKHRKSGSGNLTLRNRMCLLLVYPFLASHLSEQDRARYKNNPADLFGKARHPDMVRIGRFIGLTPN